MCVTPLSTIPSGTPRKHTGVSCPYSYPELTVPSYWFLLAVSLYCQPVSLFFPLSSTIHKGYFIGGTARLHFDKHAGHSPRRGFLGVAVCVGLVHISNTFYTCPSQTFISCLVCCIHSHLAFAHYFWSQCIHTPRDSAAYYFLWGNLNFSCPESQYLQGCRGSQSFLDRAWRFLYSVPVF